MVTQKRTKSTVGLGTGIPEVTTPSIEVAQTTTPTVSTKLTIGQVGMSLSELNASTPEGKTQSFGDRFIDSSMQAASMMFTPAIKTIKAMGDIGQKIVETGAEYTAKPALRLALVSQAKTKEKLSGVQVEPAYNKYLGRTTPPRTLKEAANDLADAVMVASMLAPLTSLAGKTGGLATKFAKPLFTDIAQPTIASMFKGGIKPVVKSGALGLTYGTLKSYATNDDWRTIAGDGVLTAVLFAGLQAGLGLVGVGAYALFTKGAPVLMTDIKVAATEAMEGGFKTAKPEAIQALANITKYKDEWIKIITKLKGEGESLDAIPIRVSRDIKGDIVSWVKGMVDDFIPKQSQTGQVKNFLTAAKKVTEETVDDVYEMAMSVTGAKRNPFTSSFFGENRMTNLFPSVPKGMRDPAKFAQYQQGIYNDSDGDIEIPDEELKQMEAEAMNDIRQDVEGAGNQKFITTYANKLNTYKKVLPDIATKDWDSAMVYAREQIKTNLTPYKKQLLQNFINDFEGLDSEVAQEYQQLSEDVSMADVPTANDVFDEIKAKFEGMKEDANTKKLLTLDSKMKEWVNKEVNKRVRDMSPDVLIGDLFENLERGEIVGKSERGLLRMKAKAKTVGARLGYLEGRKVGIQMQKQHKNEIILNEKARKQMREEVAKIKTNFTNAKKKAKTMMPQYKKAVLDAIGDIDIKGMTEKTYLKLGAMKEYFNQHPEDVNLSETVKKGLERIEKKNIKDMTLEELRALDTSVKHFIHLSTRFDIMTIAGKERSLEATSNEMIKSVEDNVKAKKVVEEEGIVSSKERVTHNWIKKKNLGRAQIRHITRNLDGQKDGGKNQEIIYGLADGATDTQLNHKFKYNDEIKKIIKELGIERTWSESGYLPGYISKIYRTITKDSKVEWVRTTLPDVGVVEMTRATRVAMYMYTQDEQASKHFSEGGFTFRSKLPVLINKIYKFSDRDIREFIKSLTPEEKALADKLWGVLGDIGKEVDGTFTKLNGYGLELVKKYLPLKVFRKGEEDLWLAGKVKAKDVLSHLNFLKERVDSKLPIYIDDVFDLTHKHIEQTAKYVGWAEPIRDMKALMSRQNYRDSVTKNYGIEVLDEMDLFVEDMESMEFKGGAMSKKAMALASKIAVSYLISPSVFAVQATSLPLASIYIDEKYVKQGVINLARNRKESIAYWNNKSVQLRSRHTGGYDKEIADVVENLAVGKDYFGVESFAVKGMKPVQWMDENIVYAIAEAVKAKYVAEGKPLDEKMVKEAEYIIIKTQTTNEIKDKASSFRDTDVLTRLTSYFRNQLNKMEILARENAQDYINGTIGKVKFAKNTLYLLLGSILGVTFVRRTMRKFRKLFDETPSEEIPLLADLTGESLKTVADMVGIGWLVDSSIDKQIKGYYSSEGINVPISDFLNTIGESVSNAIGTVTNYGEYYASGEKEGESKSTDSLLKALDGTIEVLGTLKSIPYSNIKNYGAPILRIFKALEEMSVEQISEMLDDDTETDTNVGSMKQKLLQIKNKK